MATVVHIYQDGRKIGSSPLTYIHGLARVAERPGRLGPGRLEGDAAEDYSEDVYDKIESAIDRGETSITIDGITYSWMIQVLPTVRIETTGSSGECQECGRSDHAGPLACIKTKIYGPAGRTSYIYVGECCQARLVRELHEKAERGEIEFIDARVTGPEVVRHQ